MTVSATMVTPVANFSSSKADAATLTSSTDNIPLDPKTKGHLIKNSTFENGVGLPWTEVETFPAVGTFDISGGTFNVAVKKINLPATKDNRWAVQMRHRGLTIEQGHTYKIKFTVTPDHDCSIYAKVGQQGDPYLEYWSNNYQPIPLQAGVKKTVETSFTMNQQTDAKCEFAIHLAGDGAPNGAKTETNPEQYSFKFDDIYLDDDKFPGYPMEIPEPSNAIRVNQVGYYPNLDKKATVVSSKTSPIPWKLEDLSGNVVSSGMTKVFGADHASGDNVHIIDFSDFTKQGKYKLVVNSSDVPAPVITPITPIVPANESMIFTIGNDLYTQMKSDAIKYFYQNRSGIPILAQYVERPDLARLAGHANDTLANAKDTWYSDGKAEDGKEGLKLHANYSLDISGGWYDAGDHGKYIVNGGISTWTMMNQYERAKANGEDLSKAPFGDGTMNIPESGNKTPDILDESRYNVELFLKMQVPEGQELAGMVHHKAHDERWTALGIRPDQDKQPRYLQPPSTAATLNFVAVTAQAARLWKDIDPTFANKCLKASEVAWNAAKAHPEIYAKMTGDVGGGCYGDNNVTDEFYWAAAELYTTTGTQTYLDEAKKSSHYLEMPTSLSGGEDAGTVGCFDWGNVQGLGTITLATVKSNLDSSDVQKARDNIKAAADKFVDIENSQGYGIPISESELSSTAAGLPADSTKTIKGLPWGSNSFVANSAILMAYANDFSGGSTDKYINGTERAMDYLLGCNPNVQSYVTGYGQNPLENPHHRFWSYQTDASMPKAPRGCMSGGPNSGLQDPWVKGSGWHPGEMASEKCFMDNIESWSTNEITINWNAPFAWISSYMDDKGSLPNKPIILKGDINGDDEITMADCIALKRYLVNNNYKINKANSDVNGDGQIDASDLLDLYDLV
jgi:endoglucanase